MGDDAAQLQQLSACLAQSLTPDATLRAQAEGFLQAGTTQPGFSILLMRLLATETAEAQAGPPRRYTCCLCSAQLQAVRPRPH